MVKYAELLSSSSAGMGEKERRNSCSQKEGLEETGRPKKKLRDVLQEREVASFNKF